MPDPNGHGLIYDTVSGSGPLTFEQKFSALFSGKVTSSTLGLISIIGLGLGFVIAVSSFLAAVQERRREFGIMSSIGLADEVVPNEELHARALALAGECARGPLLSQAFAKRAIDSGLSVSLAEGLRIEQDLFVEAFRTNDSQIGVTSFLEHGPGKATFTGT